MNKFKNFGSWVVKIVTGIILLLVFFSRRNPSRTLPDLSKENKESEDLKNRITDLNEELKDTETKLDNLKIKEVKDLTPKEVEDYWNK